MNKLHTDKCPLCDGNRLVSVMNCTDYHASGENFEVWQCQDCSFLFTQDVPVEAEIGKYYDTVDYISHSDTQRGLTNKIYHLVRKWMLLKKKYLIQRTTNLKKGKLLDIGTGTGYFPYTMKKAGWQVNAIEKNEHARLFAQQHFQIEVDREDTLANYPDQSFDAITLWHVMEHIEGINSLWQSIQRLLKDRGVLIVAVPNPTSYDAKKYQSMWAAYDVPRHLWHFTPSTIQQMGTKYGFVLAEQLPMPFDAFYVSILTEKYKNSSCPFLKGMWTGFIGWLHTLAKKEQSSSMIYVFRKK